MSRRDYLKYLGFKVAFAQLHLKELKQPQQMVNELSQFEARAYKRLYEMYKSTLLAIINKAKTAVDYKLENQEEMNATMKNIADEHTWDHCGIESKVDSKIIDELEKCLGV